MPIALFVGFLVIVVLWAVARRFASARASAAGILAGLAWLVVDLGSLQPA
jgi:hypothetical protein